MPHLISQKNFQNITVSSLTTTSTDEVALDVFEFIIVHDGTTTYNTEYAIIKTGSSLATFSSDISSGNVRLLVTPASTDSTTFKAIRTSINT